MSTRESNIILRLREGLSRLGLQLYAEYFNHCRFPVNNTPGAQEIAPWLK